MTFLEQRMNIKFCRPNILYNDKETYEMLKRTYSSDTLSGTQAFEWHRRFGKCRKNAEEDERSGTVFSNLLIATDWSPFVNFTAAR
ncbi:hypothetical protein TNCV_4761901 [Trichonephila clavipes]|nr:hypothetical protein TNCV_4761901 [Trichonephila clavipes]